MVDRTNIDLPPAVNFLLSASKTSIPFLLVVVPIYQKGKDDG